MIPAPRNNTLPQQTYTELWASDPSLAYMVQIELAASTNADGYKPGCILSQYSSGPNHMKFVNYDPKGTNGQNNAVLILTDEYLTPDMEKLGTQGKVLAQAVFGGATFYYPKIYYNKQDGKDDLKVPISQIGGKTAFNRVCLFAIGK